MADGFPLIMTTAGAVPTPPATIRSNLVNTVAAENPGYTDNLPGSLIEDIVSTEVGGLVQCDQARVDLVNSIGPRTANPAILLQLGQTYGVQPGTPTNTSVYVVFSGTAGFVVSQGFTVSDGAHQYVVQEGAIIATGGATGPVYCVASQTGSWAVPANSVTTLITSAPIGVTLTVTNPQSGTPSTSAESEESYRARVLQAGNAPAQGTGSYLKTLLSNLAGVQPRLVSVRQTSGGWEVICGGGDPYQIAYAIFTALFDISSLVGSTIGITAITKASPGVVTTNLNHGLTTGQNNVFIAGVLGMTAANGGPYTVTVIDEKTFSFGVNTTSFGTYTSGGAVTPNARNITVNIDDYPDTYTIPFVNPPSQVVTMDVTWNTTAPFAVSPTAVAQLGGAALVNYVNALPVGVPMNLYAMETVFQQAISSLVSPQLLTRIVIVVFINGIEVDPGAGSGIIAGDPESYFAASATAVTVTQG